ncbi:tetratricopeptide repeat protein [Algoriphagus sp. CAU 1675]|uniref:tetratricopeptide repeat protein n=1 Tax=Algoriphagus sp. CAU 1675 TaxID=3032597 RepID=UPI0023D9F767|nr:tetratricopeptide repeat protein [Algoriphagus sp. CAU 1675]MDF2157693.1 tetratricopeptide repeat protein [Algoriphagus sp. CAU 1675]
MKKLILSMILVGATSLAFGQKKVVRSAEKNFKSGDLATAMSEIEAAIANPETSSDPATYLLKAKIQLKMFGTDSTNTMETLAKGEASLATFNETFEMAGSNKEEGVGKEIYEGDILGVPDNLRPYSLETLKNVSYDKALERYNEGEMDMAYEFFNLSSEIDKTDTLSNYNAAFIANDLGRFEDAKKHLNYLLEVPDYNGKINVYYMLIPILSTEEKNPEAAYETVTRARAEFPEEKTFAEFEIQLLLQLNKMDEAMAQIQEALKTDPNNTSILLRSGYLKEKSGDIDGALADYKKSVEVDPNFYEGNYYAGALMLEKSRSILAELNSLPDDEWEKRSKSMGEEANQYYTDAIPYFEKALELRPDDTDIMSILYQVHVILKNDAEAEKYNKKLIELLGPNWMDR